MTRVTRIALVCATFAVAAMLAPAALADYSFKMPSGNIHCLISPSGGGFLRCDARFWNDRAMKLDHAEKARRARVTDAVPQRNSPVLPYGRSVTRDGFTCQSRSVGLRCQSNRSRHGFFISRERWSAF